MGEVLDEFFVPEIDRRLAAAGGRHRIDWTKAWAGTLAKSGQELVAIKDGVSDLGFAGTLFEGARFPLQNVTYYTPLGTDDIALISKTIAELQDKHPAMGEAWTRNNLVYLGGASLDTYQIFTTFPIRSIDDLKGLKVSAPGTAANWMNGTGAIAVGGISPPITRTSRPAFRKALSPSSRAHGRPSCTRSRRTSPRSISERCTRAA